MKNGNQALPQGLFILPTTQAIFPFLPKFFHHMPTGDT